MDPADRQRAQAIFDRAPFVRWLGVEVHALAAGQVETSIAVRPEHLQQDGFVHAGVLATLADHSAGGAAATLLEGSRTVLTIEFKVNLLRPARGERVRCAARVLKAGRTVVVAESEVFAERAGAEAKLVAKATVTMAVVEEPGGA